MLRVILESPFAGDIERNIKYARLCVRDSLLRGESPIASHLLYTQEGLLNDEIELERMHGINAGLEWKRLRIYKFFILIMDLVMVCNTEWITPKSTE